MSNRIEGLDRFMAWATNAPRELNDAARQAVKNRTLEMEANAKAQAPVDTGTLRRSINSQISETSGSITGEVSTNLEYATHVEYGTSKQVAQPYMTPAYVNASRQLEEDLRQAMREVSN
ncbi:HK97-gp10 family putative phage morphogenesis protein [Sporosarcina beigongshangi]|uniref:HK97-gp10 family putative phage morphogenesis protein n=1 Tax=Sporosarcina beigongshangi TaxID=2782538 RepID=UPI0019395CB3|nr:HK97-gp10 family putative phage morphogenesis protein [Sporosarcina beigongshangi]